MKAKDYLLFAVVFGWTGVLMLAFQRSVLPGQYPIWQMFSTAYVFCGFFALGLLVAGIVKRLTGD